jgi:hypothetical protein
VEGEARTEGVWVVIRERSRVSCESESLEGGVALQVVALSIVLVIGLVVLAAAVAAPADGSHGKAKKGLLHDTLECY